jgi:PIN domain nuclease of toxin-antitoxin system
VTVVLDSSAVLAAIFDEPGSEAVAEALEAGPVLGPVNLAEVAAKLIDAGFSDEDLLRTVEAFGALSPDFDVRHGLEAGRLRKATRASGLSLGDRCCLALAKSIGGRVLTADRAWAGLDVGVEIEVIR